MRTALATVLVAGVLGAVALVGDATTASFGRGGESNPAPTEVKVTGRDSGAPVGCRPRRIGTALMRWNRALNAADTRTLRTFWREERRGLRNDRRAHARGTFKWFSLTSSPSPTHENHFAAFQPRRALRYVRKRRGFRLQLTDVAGNAAYQGLWILDDGRTYQVIGKGRIKCKKRKRHPLIQVWSMRVLDPGEELPFDQCPDPAGGTRSGVLVACARAESQRSR